MLGIGHWALGIGHWAQGKAKTENANGLDGSPSLFTIHFFIKNWSEKLPDTISA